MRARRLARLPFADVLGAVTNQESHGQAGVVGPQTPYGRAVGSTQLIPGTARGMAAKLGIDYRPDLLTGTSPDAAAYQQQLGAAYLHEGMSKTDNLYDALRYYHAGPNRALWGPKTKAYANAIYSRLMS